jgi:hypothetical protein
VKLNLPKTPGLPKKKAAPATLFKNQFKPFLFYKLGFSSSPHAPFIPVPG